ncbi:hypothetical protein H8L32_04355 [Undibacterium sp. CY18W]|uniref:Uncharacterized protein n=1 Tax=Undibacterium hunanense TaxID=2762292 RepID=A0ABR6ZMA9_9BURK|nr:hypothetical protein [Undibacterium hunanense]MBC3916709.1 hypothetical protein [Undibacterium hunanense]
MATAAGCGWELPLAVPKATVSNFKIQRKLILLVIFFVWLSVVLIYGWVDVSSTMDELQANPTPDLYANNFGFQIIAFAPSKGMASLLILGVGLVGGLSYTSGHELGD